MISFIKILCSIPIILVALYFLPFLGICLIILRYFVYKKKYYSMPVTLIVVGLLLLIPQIIETIITNFKLENISYLVKLTDSEIYVKLIGYSRFIIITGVIFLIVSFAIKSLIEKVGTKLGSSLGNYINRTEQREAEVLRQNDLIMKERQEKAQNTHLVHCSKCGAENLLSEKTGKCKYCRNDLINK